MEIEIVTDSDGKTPKYICGICHRRFDKEILLTAHMKRHAADFQCKECGRRCKTLRSFRNHSMIHNDFYPFQCEYCQKRFRNAVKLKIHVRYHTGEKPYVCEFCHTDFAQLERLKIHKYDQMKEKYDQIRAKDPFPKLPPPIEIAKKVLAEYASTSSNTIITLKSVKSVNDESDEDEEMEEKDSSEELEMVEWERLETVSDEQNLVGEVELDDKSDLYEIVLHDGEGLIVEEGDIEMNYIIEDSQDEESLNVQQ